MVKMVVSAKWTEQLRVCLGHLVEMAIIVEVVDVVVLLKTYGLGHIIGVVSFLRMSTSK